MINALLTRVLLVIAPAVMLFALTQRWYYAESVGVVFRTRYPLTQDFLWVTLGCCVVFIIVALLLGLRMKWLLGAASLVLSVTAVATLFEGHGRIDFPNDPGGVTTNWFDVARFAGIAWLFESAALLILAMVSERMSDAGNELRDFRGLLAAWWGRSYVPAPDSDPVARVSGLPLKAWLGIGSAALMVLGAFGPWGKVITGFGSASVSGTDGSNDGWIVVGAAIVGVLAVFGAARRESVRLAVLGGVAGLGSLAACIYDRSRFEDVDDEGFLTVGWGLNLALLASAGLMIFSVVLIKRHPPAYAAQAAGSVSRQIDYYGQTVASTPGEPTVSGAAPSVAPVSLDAALPVAELERLADLRDRGALTDEEFQQAKRQLLGE